MKPRCFPPTLCFHAGRFCLNGVFVSACLAVMSAPLGSAEGVPLVYDQEDMGANSPRPPLPEFSALPSIPHLPDPFKKADGSRITTRDEWRTRRAEIRAMLEHYGVGAKPGRPDTFKATLEGNIIKIAVGEGTNTFDITATINRPVDAPDAPTLRRAVFPATSSANAGSPRSLTGPAKWRRRGLPASPMPPAIFTSSTRNRRRVT
jgi:hypothetical protein